MTPEEFRRCGHDLVDWIADYRASVARRPVAPDVRPGDVAKKIPATPPADPEPAGRILDDVDAAIVPGLTHWTHPRFFGYFPANSDPASVLGDWLSTGLGVLGLSWDASPALTELEIVMADWVRQMVGLADGWRGVIQDTASTSTLVALVSARERTTELGQRRTGLQGEHQPLVVYASDLSHSSVAKAARVAGFGDDHVRAIPHDANGALRVDALAAAIETDRRADRRPCALVATTGTTTTGSVDPIDAMADVAATHRLWLHVDAAMAGSAMLLPECRHLWAGVDRADSVVLNPHKWLGAAFDCSLYYVRDVDHLTRVMGTAPSYLRSSADADVVNFRDWGVPLGRRFRALKLWYLIRATGTRALAARLRRDLDNARWLAGAVSATPGWTVTSPLILQTVCVRHEPPGLGGDALDRHTLDWVDRVNRSGAALLTPARYDGRWMARVSIGGLTTERDDVEAAWTSMCRAAERDPA